MEQFNGKIYEMYTTLKKQKKLDDELMWKLKADFKKLHDSSMAWVEEHKAREEELRQKMSDMLDEQKINQEKLLKEIRARDEEILRLNLLLAEKTVINNSTAAEPLNRNSEILQSQTPTGKAKQTSQSSSKAKRVLLSKEAIVPNSSNPEEESRELECSRNRTRGIGDGTNESSSAHMFHMLLESLVCMKISLNRGTEGFSFSACHENTGYSFTLTWLEQRNEWRYKVSSLGSLERVARDWMNQDIIFSMDMCPMFFQKVSHVIR